LARNKYLAGVFLALAAAANVGNAQTIASQTIASLSDLPDNPAVQQSTPSAQTTAAKPAQDPPPGAQSPDPPAQTSAEQLRQEEHQRILGIMPTFNMTNNRDALPLTTRQKFQLFFKSTTDPWTIGIVGISAGVGQAENSPHEWGGGVEGYAKRFGAGYADTFDGNLWGNAILTSWWHEDPRYYRMGTGSVVHRGLWAAGSSFWCKRDNGTWGPNYANVLGNIIGGTIANLYYPPSQRGVDATFDHSASVTGYGILGAEVIEFWPDIARHYVRKHQEKEAREAAKHGAQQGTSSTQ
jgi:hypothetical protein